MVYLWVQQHQRHNKDSKLSALLAHCNKCKIMSSQGIQFLFWFSEKEKKAPYLYDGWNSYDHEILVDMASLEEPIVSNFWDKHIITYLCQDLKKTLWWVGKFHHPLYTGKSLFLFCSLQSKDFVVTLIQLPTKWLKISILKLKNLIESNCFIIIFEIQMPINKRQYY